MTSRGVLLRGQVTRERDGITHPWPWPGRLRSELALRVILHASTTMGTKEMGFFAEFQGRIPGLEKHV